MGYHRAGFEVIGVDIKPQPHYPFTFHEADAMTFPLDGFDAIHASPPCQAFTAMKTMPNAGTHTDLLTPTRTRLRANGKPYVIENVVGAPMNEPFVLCGSMFDLGIREPARQLRRHRLFEASFFILTPLCRHHGGTIGIYGDHARDRRRKASTGDRGVDFPDSRKISLAQEAMGIDWIKSWRGLSQAIPPAYTEFIGKALQEATDFRPV